MRNYAVFIMTHGRADNVITYKTLQRCGYTGKTYFVIDTDDDQRDIYIKNFGKENVLIFDKNEEQKKMDTGDAGGSMKCVVFARNVCFRLAEELGLDYFIEADDDYTEFSFRVDVNGTLKGVTIQDLDSVFEAAFEFLDDSKALAVAPAQGGDFIGGSTWKMWRDRLKRKCMNLFFCRTDRPIHFIGRINEDVTTYTYYGQQGKLFFTFADFQLNQKQTQAQRGGMTDTYLDSGTYLKSFYSVMWSPSCVKIAPMGVGSGTAHYRIHHEINWERCTPKILNEKWKKAHDHNR